MNGDRMVLVTGAARGIGLGIARRLVAGGADVVLADIDADAGATAASGLGPKASFVALDVSDEAQVERVFDALGGELTGLVNNAGVSDPYCGPLESLRLADWQRWIDVNLTGAFLMCRRALPSLRRTRGAIVNIASTRALQSEPQTEAYAASKGGLVAFTHALAMSAAPEVRVNCISPGWIDTRAPEARQAEPLRAIDHRQHPAGRVGQPEDVAALTEFLLADDAGFATGQNWVLDGGMVRKMIYED